MLRKLALKNYRCFENSELDLRDTSIIVGSNNSGKSTIIEALRIVSDIAQKFRHTNYIYAPSILGLQASVRGIHVNINQLRIDLRTIVHQYKEGVFSQIIATFDRKVCIHVYLSSEVSFAVVDVDGINVKRKSDAIKVEELDIFIMPQIGLIREDETKLTEETVQRDMSTRLASRHFRNELLLYRNRHFDSFKEIAQSTWTGLRITDLIYDPIDDKIQLLVYDANYAAEIGLMGSGLQMWLQIIWFISRCPHEATIVLDEPDVYMHPDLQRKVLKVVQRRFKQIILATHSVEIISGVEPYQIVTVDKNTRKMQYAGNYKAVQEVICNLGSEYNLSLIRLGNAKKCIFVEGKDAKTLTKFQNILYPQSQIPIDQMPIVPLGGWSRFAEALGAARLFHDETGGEIGTYCILDRDYHTDDEIDDLYKRASINHLVLHVWKCKEIENYIAAPEAVFRVANAPEETFEEFKNDMFNELNLLRKQTIGCILDQLLTNDKSKSPSYYLEIAEAVLNAKWDSLEGRLSIVNGKDLISTINSWVRMKYRRSCSRAKMFDQLFPRNVPDEMKSVIDMLQNS